jgi:hypothetical protein
VSQPFFLAVIEALHRWAQVNHPMARDPLASIMDLLPPATIFNGANKRYLLFGGRPRMPVEQEA